ncbi:MAG: hypothetical protein RLZZ297_606, partial [Chloroflexota bacterium]
CRVDAAGDPQQIARAILTRVTRG